MIAVSVTIVFAITLQLPIMTTGWPLWDMERGFRGYGAWGFGGYQKYNPSIPNRYYRTIVESKFALLILFNMTNINCTVM
jgi:hypothetical protein